MALTVDIDEQGSRLELHPTSEAEEKSYAMEAASALERLVERLRADDEFKQGLAREPRATMIRAGIIIEKEAIELLMKHDPDRFDRVCDSLFDRLDPDFLHALLVPSCDPGNVM
jgi:hypothetical protein